MLSFSLEGLTRTTAGVGAPRQRDGPLRTPSAVPFQDSLRGAMGRRYLLRRSLVSSLHHPPLEGCTPKMPFNNHLSWYKLVEPAEGKFVYGLSPENLQELGEPPHWICPKCHATDKLAVLHHNDEFNTWDCSLCGAEYGLDDARP